MVRRSLPATASRSFVDFFVNLVDDVGGPGPIEADGRARAGRSRRREAARERRRDAAEEGLRLRRGRRAPGP